MIDQLDIPDEIKEKIPTEVASGWEGINPSQAFLSGVICAAYLTEDEAKCIIASFEENNTFDIDPGFIELLDGKKDIEYKLCPRYTFILAVIQGLRNRGFDVSI